MACCEMGAYCGYKSLDPVDATDDGLSDVAESEISADQDLKSKNKNPGDAARKARRTRGASTVDRMNLGYPKDGNRFRLQSQSDMQAAVLWMEGKPRVAEEPKPAPAPAPAPAQEWQDPEVKGDKRGRLLPIGLIGSVLVCVVCCIFVHQQIVAEVLGDVFGIVFIAVVGIVFLFTSICLALAALTDPGQLPPNVDTMPERAHKSFMYPRPLLRYDHYCRWIMNCIALKNHREFFCMLVGLVLISVGGFCIDIPLLCICVSRREWLFVIAMALHLGYSAGVSYYVVPIFRLHLRFVSRNELANEWKKDLFYVLDDRWVGDLDAIEFNERYDEFEYDPSRNPWDQGCCMNCCLFWCTSRSSERELGEF